MSTVALIVLVVVALLLAAMLAAVGRHSTARHAPSDDPWFRSHAEASRGDRG